MDIAFGGKSRVFRTVAFQGKQSPVVHIIVAIGDNGVQATAVLAQEGPAFTVHLIAATLAGHFHQVSGRGQETVFAQESIQRIF